VVFDIRKREDKQTDRHTDTLITILLAHSGGELIIKAFSESIGEEKLFREIESGLR